MTFGRWVDEEAHRGLPVSVYCVGVVQYSALILRRRRGDAEIDVGRDSSKLIVR